MIKHQCSVIETFIFRERFRALLFHFDDTFFSFECDFSAERSLGIIDLGFRKNRFAEM